VRAYPSEACAACGGHGFRNLPEAGRVLRAIRKRFGISQTAMARELGVSPQRVNDWEAGRRLTPREITEVGEAACRKLGGLPQPPEPPESPEPPRECRLAPSAIWGRPAPRLHRKIRVTRSA
jgi:transcriptional regulator with XRE-family HTH domain